MAIYNRWGEPVKIVANCGEHQPKGFCAPAILVRVQFGDGDEKYQFAQFLKADEGFPEILSAIQSTRTASLSTMALKAAIRQAL